MHRVVRLVPFWLPVLVLSAVMVTAPVAHAGDGRDWNRADDPLLDGVGLHAGKVGGVGLAFKFPLQWWLYGQVAGGIWHTADNQRHNIGFEAQYLLRQDRVLRIFVAGGLGYFSHKERLKVVDGADVFEKHTSLNTGFGVGLEWLRSSRLALQAELDFTHQGDDGSITVFPQLGAFFYF